MKPPTRYATVVRGLSNSRWSEFIPAASNGDWPPPRKVWNPTINKHKSRFHIGQFKGSFWLSWGWGCNMIPVTGRFNATESWSVRTPETVSLSIMTMEPVTWRARGCLIPRRDMTKEEKRWGICINSQQYSNQTRFVLRITWSARWCGALGIEVMKEAWPTEE